MTRKDIYHYTVKKALDKDDWKITHDPFRLRIGKKRLAMDLGAERLISAEKGTRKIVVEVKSFVGRSDVKDLQQALGQYVLYHQVLVEQNIGRELYLAVPLRTYQSIFQSELGAILLKNKLVRLLVFEEIQEVIVEWVPD
jgi:XisH protein